jgi:hypothetical protein
MKNIKGFQKLAIQIAILSFSMIALSFLTETQLWLDYFNYDAILKDDGCYHGFNNRWVTYQHHHWNYRGWVYFITGCVYFILSIIKIATSHNKKDFIN